MADPGQGIFTKRSFLPEYVEAARASRGSGDVADPATERTANESSDTNVLLPVLGGLAVLAVGAGLLAKRRRPIGDDDD